MLAVPAGWAAWFLSRNRLFVANESGQVVRNLSILVCDCTIEFGDLPPGGQAFARFGTPADESSFTVRGRLDDGTTIDESCGYVVWEDYNQAFHIIIRPSGQLECC